MALNTDGVNIIITGDASQVIKEIEATEKAIAGVKGSQINITANSSQAVGEAQKVVDVVNSVNDGHVEITADSSQAVDAAGKAAEAIENIDSGDVEITADGSQAVDEAKKTTEAIENIKDARIEITADAIQAIRSVRMTREELEKFKQDFGIIDIHLNVNNKFKILGKQLASHFSSSFMKESAKWSVMFDSVGKTLEAGFGVAFKTITAGATTVAGVLTSVAKSALAVGGEFEAQMTTVKVISGATAEELDALIKKAREMGATLPITAKDSAMAMQMLVQRGTSAADTLATVDSVANLAIAQSTSMGEVAELLGMAMSSFNLEIGEAAKITAVFNNACNQSPLSMQRLMAAMKYAAPAAGSLGISITEAVSAMEAISKVLPSGEMIGTGYAMVLSKIAEKSRIAGVETHNLDGSLRTVKDIFLDLKKAQVSYAELNDAFGVRGVKAALALIQNVEALEEYEERLKDYSSTQAAVDEKAKTFTNTMMALSSAIEAFHIEVFTQIKEQSKDAVSGVTQLVRAFAEWVGQTKVAEKALNAFFDGLGFRIPTGTDFKKLLEQIDVDSIAEKIKTLGSTIRSIAEGIVSFASKIQTPLMFLIKHLDTFATISFWGWISGKALQIPLTLVMMAAGFSQLYTALKGLTALKFGGILAFLNNSLLIKGAGIAIAGSYLLKTIGEYRDAWKQFHDAEAEEKRYLQEQAKADSTINLDFKLNVKTGFEKLPEAYTKVSDGIRKIIDRDTQELREAFRNNVVTAIDTVIDKFPEMAGALKNSVSNLNNSTLSQLSKALQGNKEAFDSLPPHMKKVLEQLYYMDVQAGQATGSLGKLLIEMKKLEAEAAAGNKPIKSQLALFAEELSASVNSLLDSVPADIEKFQEFLGNQNIEVPVNVSLAQAQKQIQELSKSIGEKFNIPADIVSSAIVTQLEKLANKGDKTAQALRNGWKDASKPLEDFMQTAQDVVKYLGASPEKFTPALNSLTKGIQKIDPLTGKVTEQFKKAYDALKQWASVTFDQLAQRIQRLRKAVEGGFIDQSALEAEFERASKQVKLQIATELQPTRDNYKSRDAFNSVVASEYVARMGELGGEAFMNLLQREFSGLYDQSGAAIGAAIMRQVDNGLGSDAILKVNGVDMLKQGGQTQSVLDFSAIGETFTDTVNPLISKIEQVTVPQAASGNDISSHFPEVIAAMNKLQSSIDNNSSVLGRANDALLAFVNSIGNINVQNPANPVLAVQDYSSQFANVIKEIQAVSTGLSAVQSIAQANVSAVNSIGVTAGSIQSLNQAHSTTLAEIINAVKAVEIAVKTTNAGNNYDIDINQQGFIVQKKADADLVARNTASALRSGLGNGGV